MKNSLPARNPKPLRVVSLDMEFGMAKKGKVCLIGLAVFLAATSYCGLLGAQQASASQPVRPIGVVTHVQSDQLTLRTDTGPDLTVHLPEGVSVLRIPPGAKTLKDAVKISVGEINAGDRVLVAGSVAGDQKSMVASRVIDMSKAALVVAHEAEEREWERRGISGVVQSMNPADKSIVLSVPNTPPTPSNPTHPVTLTIESGAKLLRYAPDSVKFSDAKPGTFSEIQAGDQVRALGTKSADGTHFSAEEVVSGTFRNIPATVISTDASKGTITVKDLSTGKPVLVKTNVDSKLHRLPPFIAMVIARFNSGGGQGQNATAEKSDNSNGGAPHFQPGSGQSGGRGAYGPPGGPSGMQRGGRLGNFKQMLDHMPPLAISELKPGDPLIVVSTEGSQPGEVTAIAVLSGVEPILEARPKGSEEVRLGPWNMSIGGGGGAAGGGGAGGEQGP
jgi:hypothetical protein